MAKKLMSDFDRIMGKYLLDAETGCLNFTGKLDKDGYARSLKVGSATDGSRRTVRPHRWLFEQRHGELSPDFVPDHKCRNRKCGNVDHMEKVTWLENHRRGLRAIAKTCPKGHAISGENEVKRKGGHRCRICHNAYHAEYQRKTGYVHSNAWKQRQVEARRGVG